MAWQSGGSNNEEMVDNLKRFGVIHSDAVVDAFRAVDRRYFVPSSSVSRAHADEPIREGHFHISAPHIYGCIVEAMHISPKSSMSFLNIGSGTGYLSSIVAHILGPTGICYGIEINRNAYEHGISAVDHWKEENSHLELPLMEFIHGNGLNIDTTSGVSVIGFDRIYVGAAIERSKLSQLVSLLRIGGILVVPVDDELLQVTRVRESTNTVLSVPRSVRGGPPTLSEDFTEHVITGVRFASLVKEPLIPTVIPNRVWGPSLHKHYPESFRKSCKEIMLCSRAPLFQPPPVPVPNSSGGNSQVNLACQLPKYLWLEIISFTHRDWFAQPQSEVDILRRRLEQEQLAVQRSEEARREAEMRLRMVERERDGYRRLAFRTQARLQAIINERGTTINEPDDMVVDQQSSATTAATNLRLRAFNALLRQFQQDISDDDDQDAELDEDEDHDDDDHMSHVETISDAIDDATTSSDEDNLESIESSSSESDLHMTHMDPPQTETSSHMSVIRTARTISISSDDMKLSHI